MGSIAVLFGAAAMHLLSCYSIDFVTATKDWRTVTPPVLRPAADA
jgi:hypothetical protein